MNFVFFSTALWDYSEGVQPAPRLARELARRGHHLVFLQPRAPGVSIKSPSIRILGLNDLGLGSALVERAWHGLAIESLATVAHNLAKVLLEAENPNEPAIAVWFAPFDPFVRLLPVFRALSHGVIYYPQDDFSQTALFGHYRHSAFAEQYMLSQADCLIALSRPVAEKLEQCGRHAYLIPDGIDLADFRTENKSSEDPPGLVRGKRTLGFWGYLSDDLVDPRFLQFVAENRPNWSINLVGTHNPASSSIDRLKLTPNIHFIGQVAHHRLKEYGKNFDACLIPAPHNDLSKGRDPLKVYEYLAMYKPVITSNMPQLVGMPFLHDASNPQDFLIEIEGSLSRPVDRDLVDSYLKEQTWQVRADAFLKVVDQVKWVPKCVIPRDQWEVKAPKLVLPPFEKQEAGIDTYLTSLESELEHTRDWAIDLERQVNDKNRELDRFYDFLPVRMTRAIWHTLRKVTGRR